MFNNISNPNSLTWQALESGGGGGGGIRAK